MVAVVALLHGAPGAYGISFPDFQGCISGGTTIDEALQRGREALTFHVENMVDVGEALPKVRNLEEIREDPTFSEDLADAIVAVVETELPSRSVRVNISIDERLLERIDRTAAGAGETRSGFIAEAARQRLAGGANLPVRAPSASRRRSVKRGAKNKRSARLSRSKSGIRSAQRQRPRRRHRR